jgi:soluble lytic murein transglycosylase
LIRVLLVLLVALRVFGATEVAVARGDAGVLESTSPLLSGDDRKRYEAAFRAAAAGQWRTALKAASRADISLPAKVLQWMYLSEAGATATFEEFRTFIDANPEWPRRAALLRNAEAAAAGLASDAAVNAWFSRFPPTTGEGRLRLADALLTLGDESRATPLIREAWIRGRFSARDERTVHRRYRRFLRPEDHVARLDHLIWDEQRAAAQRMLPHVDPATRALGMARIALMVSAGNVDTLIAKVPAHLQDDPGLVFERVQWRRRKGLEDRAIELLVTVPPEREQNDRWWTERHILARDALGTGDAKTAYALARGHGQTDRAAVAEAEWLAGWIALRFLKDPGAAFTHFNRIYQEVRFPISIARAAYWAGLAAAELGYNDTADAWYAEAAAFPTTYYGQLAILARQAPASLVLSPDPVPDVTAVATFNDRELVRVLRLMAELDQRDLMDVFALRLAELTTTPAELQVLADTVERLGRTDLAVAVAKLGERRGMSLTSRSYPVVDLNDLATVDPALVHSVIRQESRFDPDATSHAGARGLMQLMPTTARMTAKQISVRYDRKKLHDPDYNTALGVAHLSRVINEFDGSYILALAAYNAGASRVRRWIRDFGDPRDSSVDVIDWIERIPFSETRNYVQRVLENLQVYRARLASLRVELQLAKDLRR